MKQLYARRQIAYAEAHVRIDASGPIEDVVEQLLERIDF
jgi:thymidylate kinase